MKEGDFSDDTFECAEGYICDAGCRVPNPGLDLSDQRCADPADETCGEPCPPGFYCPRKTSSTVIAPVGCPAG
jgi:hypothetical protein